MVDMARPQDSADELSDLVVARERVLKLPILYHTNMHLLIIGLNFAPELTGIGKYTGEMAAWFARRGHRITVITSPPYYPTWKVASGYRSWAWQAEAWKGCSVIRCPLYVPHRVTGVRRVVHLGSFSLSSALPAVY